ncbi:sugar-binding transcriptional regulator [Enterococcus sp. BWM-S5]|uniref:Sugar-binding transcriptional regulator n=1 Tax=Enterococcus larvae TaxID=2794352 RepID=A0ABS4CMR7_9ENTE|nr:sugar-binding transcriptional regulator [Enterococcus larvae]MBP1047750.1 sugar-binding transcriptional regulator [Enterococcus larvae]
MREEKKKLLAKAAYLYYVEEKTQNEIAEELNIYRTTISRMLKQAQKEGIVKIHIEGIDSEIFSLEQHVKQKYGLKQIEIVSVGKEETEAEKDEQLSQTAAYFIKRNIEPNMTVGVSWGATLGKAISRIENKRIGNTTIVPIVGGPSHVNSQYHVNTLVYELARKLNGQSIFVNATVIQETKKLKTGIFESKYFGELKEHWQRLDMAIVGIGGSLSFKKSQWRDLLTEEDYEALRLREAVGDCCCRFFDQDGKLLTGDLYDRTIGLDLKELSKIPHAVGIARGKVKAKAILAMIKRGYIHSLVTDQETILEVLRLDKDSTFQV